MISTIAFVIGAIVGGLISNYAFQRPKKIINEIIEIAIFYLIAIILSTMIFALNWIAFLVIGFISAITARGISSNFQKTKLKFEKKVKVSRVGLLIGLNNALRRRGFEPNEIKSIAKEAGFREEEIKEVIK